MARNRPPTPPAEPDHWRPSLWLRALVATEPSPWPTGRSVRAGLTLAGPLVLGVAVDELVIGLWISLGALMLAAGEMPAPYRTRFAQCAVITPLGSSAVLLGTLSEVPTPLAVAVMTVVAFVAGILSGYSAALSMGSMQAMILSAVAIGVPAADPYWRSALLVAAGGVLYTAVLGIEALTDRRRPVRAALADIVSALTALAQARAAGADDLSELRAAALESIDELTAMAVRHRATAPGPSADSYRAGAVIRTADALMARLMSTAVTPLQARDAADRLIELGRPSRPTAGRGRGRSGPRPTRPRTGSTRWMRRSGAARSPAPECPIPDDAASRGRATNSSDPPDASHCASASPTSPTSPCRSAIRTGSR